MKEPQPRRRLSQAEIMGIRRRRMIEAGMPRELAAMVVRLEVGLWEGMTVGDQRKATGAVWRCSTLVSEVEGYILANHMRLGASGGKLHGERYHLAPTTLTTDLADYVLGPFAYTMAMVEDVDLKTIEGVDSFVLADDPNNITRWLDAHPKRVAAARKRLGDLVGKFSCYG